MALSLSSFSRVFATLAVGAVFLAGCGAGNETNEPDDSSTVTQSQDSNTPSGSTETASGGANDDEPGNGSSGEGNSANGGSEEQDELELPPRSEFTEDIERAKTMTAEEVEAYSENLVAELNAEYNEATQEEHQTLLQELSDLEEEFAPEYEALFAEQEQAIEALGNEGSPEQLDAIGLEFGNRKRDLDSRFDAEQQKAHDRFMEATEPTRLEFEPRFIEQHARYVYMLEAAEEN